MNSIKKVFAALLPERKRQPLTDWEKGKLILEHFSVRNVSEEAMLDALITLLLSVPAPADELSALQEKISGYIDELVGIHVHMNEVDLQDIQAWLESGATIGEVRARTLAQRSIEV